MLIIISNSVIVNRFDYNKIMVEFDRKVFAERLKELRAERGVGQRTLAEILDLSNSSISYWETCKQEPTAGALYKLACYFNVSTDYLLGLEE